jgi:hypothetical protein
MFSRSTIRRAAVTVAALAMPVMLFATAVPASAAGGKLCETYGSYCLNAQAISLYESIYEGPQSNARLLTAVKQSGTFEGHSQYKIKFTNSSSWCVGAIDHGTEVDVDVKPCATDLSVIWAQNGTRWINKYWTQHNAIQCSPGNSDVYLAGQGHSGYPYKISCLGQYGYLYQFSWR